MKTIFTSLFALASMATLSAQNITFQSPELYPEGTAYNKKDKSIYVTSLRFGKIGKVSLDGKYTPFIDDKDVISAIGTLIDEKTNTIYVAVSDPGVSVKTNPTTQTKLAKVAAYDLATGKRKFLADLGALNVDGNNFANDLTIDGDGNVYVTNSLSSSIYKIDSKGVPTLFAKSDAWTGPSFTLNGIRYHKDGFLIVARADQGVLYKVDIKHPEKITAIKTDTLVGADGISLSESGNELMVISNSKHQIYKLSTQDKWATAKLEKSVASLSPFPTTGVFVDGKYYVLNAKLHELFNPQPGIEFSKEFTLQEVKF